MKQKIKMTFVFSLLTIFAVTSSLFGAEVSRQSAPIKTSKTSAQPAAIKKLPNIIKIDKSLINMPYHNKNLGQEFYDGWKQVTDTYNLMPKKIAAAEQATNVLNNTLDICGSKDYTQSDQKNAGCDVNDTLGNCSQKLAKACLQADYDKLLKALVDLDTTIKKLRDAANKMRDFTAIENLNL
jgi:hypothetical protein